MADYLNPDSMLTPMGSNSMYAPTYMDMLTSDVQRKLQAQEGLRHTNMMNEEDRRAKPWLTEAAISEAKMKSDRDLAMADPAMVQAWKQGQLGGFDESMAKGSLAKGTLESDIGMKNAANQFGTNQVKYLDEYSKLAKIYQPLQAMVNSGMDPKMIQGNIMRLFKQQGAGTDWMNPEYMQALELLSKDPMKLMQVMDSQMGSLMNQAQRFELTKQREGDMADMDRAQVQEQGAAKRQATTKPSDYQIILNAVQSDPAWTNKTMREQSEEAARIYAGRSAAAYQTVTEEGWEKIILPDGSIAYKEIKTKTPGTGSKTAPASKPGAVIKYDTQGNRIP